MRNIGITDIKAILEKLLNDEITREEAADWASKYREAEDNNELEYDPKKFERLIWESIIFIEGIDLQDAPNSYLHNQGDIQIFFDELMAGIQTQ